MGWPLGAERRKLASSRASVSTDGWLREDSGKTVFPWVWLAPHRVVARSPESCPVQLELLTEPS